MCFSIYTATAQTFNLGSWNILNIKYNHDEKWFFLEKHNCVNYNNTVTFTITNTKAELTTRFIKV